MTASTFVLLASALARFSSLAGARQEASTSMQLRVSADALC